MAGKKNIRSIRFSDELAELIDQQQGRNFTEKFENLVTRCVWEQPAKERTLKQLEQLIKEKRRQLQELSAQATALKTTINELVPKVCDLENAIGKAVEKWDL